MSDQRAPTAAQKRRGDILVKTVLGTYLVTAFFAASNLGWYVALVVLGIAVFVAGFTDCVNTRKARSDDE
ncbi:hypothetical protein OVA21_04010 [Dietzia sp. SL131]|uniref:hypothetical protein n=1 Tax=Dietzia sp. SL131 TaxID=2995149 RepID=UPI00227C71C2|nr:hypothetical protein [Dietzia sp. SL131]MCY1656386.1 hypothetical protein [Dietzia sp. SL131]